MIVEDRTPAPRLSISIADKTRHESKPIWTASAVMCIARNNSFVMFNVLHLYQCNELSYFAHCQENSTVVY